MRFIQFLITVSLCLQLIACTKGDATRSPCPTAGRCLEYGNQDEPASLDPHHVTGSTEVRILGDVFVGLTQSGSDGLPLPGVADRWQTSADGLTWTFHLRAASWSDGTPVTADDFVFAFRRAVDPSTAAELAPLLYILANGQAVNAGSLPATALGVNAPAPDIVELHLSHPAPYLPELATYPIMAPLPRKVLQTWGEAWTDPRHFVSDGPYVVRSWRQGDRVHVVRNPHFWESGALCFDEINYFPTTDSISAERRVQRGELDLNTDYQSNRAPLLRTKMPDYVQTARYLSTTYLVFNTRLPALSDRRVRQALSMSIDNDFIAQKVLLAGQTPAHSLVPPGTANGTASAQTFWASWPLERRRTEARRLLAAAGYNSAHPLSLELKYRNQPDPQLFLPAVQADWRAIGVQATLVQNETQVAYAAYQLGDFQVGDAGVTADFNDPVAFLGDFRSQAAGRNYGGYRRDAFDRLLESADHEPDSGRRATLLSEAEQQLLDDAAIAPVYFSVSRALLNPAIGGWLNNLSARHPARYLCRGNPWPDRLRADAQGMHDVMMENHPGPNDELRPQFLVELSQGLEEARRRASVVRDYSGYWWALQGYAARFNDGHLRLESQAPQNPRQTWPGFLTGFRADVQRVVTRMDGASIPPIGARLVSCGSEDARTLAAGHIGAFTGRWDLAAMRLRYGGTLFLDRENPFAAPPSQCVFEIEGALRSYALQWWPIETADAASRLQSTWQEVHPPIGITQRASGSLWISLPSFDFSPQSPYYAGLNQVLERLRRQPGTIHGAARIVLDVRGNHGGSSHWSHRIAELLWGAGRTEAVDLDPKAVDWRASRGNIDYLMSAEALARSGAHADPGLLADFEQTIAGMQAAAAHAQSFWREVPSPRLPDSVIRHDAATPAPLPPIYVLTDAACGSACLDAVDLWKALGAIQVGQETAADTFYMDVRRVPLPSAVSSLWLPMKVVRGRPRGWNTPQTPAASYEGDMADTDAIDRWIKTLRAGAGRPRPFDAAATSAPASPPPIPGRPGRKPAQKPVPARPE
jgi:oligopeptide transport system substrate-binding protein